MGNNVFRYFLEWLRLEIAPKHYLEWLDQHIHAYFAVGTAQLLSSCHFTLSLNLRHVLINWIELNTCLVVDLGAPLLGSVEAIKSTLSGVTFGLPVSEVTSDFFLVLSS